MGNSIFTMLGNQQSQNVIQQVLSLIGNKNPEQVMNMLMRQNPQFAQFVNNNKGKAPEQIAKENGIDYSLIQNIIRR